MEIIECKANEFFDEVNSVCDSDWKRYIHCEKEGYFANPYNCHTFVMCYGIVSQLRIAVMNCSKDSDGHLMVWDQQDTTCVRDIGQCQERALPDFQTTTALTSTLATLSTTTVEQFSNWAEVERDVDYRIIYDKVIQCLEEGLFRNPYDCHKFYKCHYEKSGDTFLQIELYVCRDRELVFDNDRGQCVHHEETQSCSETNIQIPYIADNIHHSFEKYKYRTHFEFNEKF